ncbi:MAG: ATP-binding cassette domain-containing protein [Clostridia bacterium]|nr:ATP-binding cassette domain-containing protein [Clostridia bacterium]
MNVAIQTSKLKKSFGDTVAVDDLDLCVYQGELLALLGLNGAGKSTTVRMLCGLLSPDGGEAEVLGKDVIKEAQVVKSFIGVSPQESATAPNLTVYENLELVARLHGMSRETARARIAELEAVFSLDEVRNKKSKTLSGGWRRRLSIAMALVSKPQVLFLDEPTLGLDVVARRELWRLIESLRGKVTIILTTHYLEEAEALSDRVAVMARGKLCAVGTPRELCALTACEKFEDAFIKLASGEEGTK